MQLNPTNKSHDDKELCGKRSTGTESTQRITNDHGQGLFSSGANPHILFVAGDLSQANNEATNADNSNLQDDGAKYVSQVRKR